MLPEREAGALPAASVKCRIFSTGYCLASEHHVFTGGPHVSLKCHALVALITHPAAGHLLFDTGYAYRRLRSATRRLPYRLYRRAAPFFTSPDEAAVTVLSRRFGISAEQISSVILSHFHPDHLSGLGDFPDSRIIVSEDGYRQASRMSGLRALACGILPDLLPADFVTRAQMLPSEFRDAALPHLGPTHDLFGDGLLRLVRLPGHAKGQLGLLARTERGPIFLVADAAYTRRNIRENRPPHRITSLFTEGESAVKQTLQRLHEFSKECPEVVLIPTHCPEAYREWERNER